MQILQALLMMLLTLSLHLPPDKTQPPFQGGIRKGKGGIVKPLTPVARLVDPVAIAIEPRGSLVVADSRIDGVVRVNPHTGTLALVSGLGRGGGPAISPQSMAVEANGFLVVIDGNRLVRVHPATGDRTVMSGCTTGSDSHTCTGDVIGTGPPLSTFSPIAVEADGSLVVAGARLVRVNPVTGDRSLVSGCTTESFAESCTEDIIGQGPFIQVSGGDGIAVEASGSLVVTDRGRILRVDPVTGDRTIVSGCATGEPFGECTGDVIGRGPLFHNLHPIAVEADGSLVVPDGTRIIRVHPVTGDRTVVSDNEMHTGPSLDSSPSIAIEANGSLVVITDFFSANIARVDPMTGDRILVTDITVGNGPSFRMPRAMAIEADGSLVVVDEFIGEVIRVNPMTGDRAVVSSRTIGKGAAFLWPQDIGVEANGALVVVDTYRQAVVRVDPATGDRTTVSGCTVDEVGDFLECLGENMGDGPIFNVPLAIAVEAAGSFVVTNDTQVIRVDPLTGNRTLVSDNTTGQGPPLGSLASIVVEPEGSLVVLDALYNRVVRLDPTTGDRTIVSGCATNEASGCTGDVIGSGLLWTFPEDGMAVEADGSLLVIDRGVAVVRVDAVTGNRTTISGCTESGTPSTFCIGKRIGIGPPFLDLKDIAVEADGSLAVIDGSFQVLMRVDPICGNRTVVSQ